MALPRQSPNSQRSTLQTHETRSTCVTSLQVPCAVAEKSSWQMGRNSSLEVATRPARLQFHLKWSLAFSHEEADTRLLLHAKHASNSRSRVIIQSPDTDLLVLCATHFESISCQELWFKTGVRDHHRYVPVHRLSEKLGQKLCRCLSAFHALTRCDTTSALAGVLKKA